MKESRRGTSIRWWIGPSNASSTSPNTPDWQDERSEPPVVPPLTGRIKKRRDAATLTDFLRLYPDAKHRI